MLRWPDPTTKAFGGPALRGQLQVVEVPGCGHAPALNVPDQLERVTVFIEASA